MTNALQRLATAKPIQPKLSLPAKQNEPSVFDPRLNVSVAGRSNPKEALGKLPTVLKEQAAKLPSSGTPLDQARVGKDLASRQQGSKALEQRMKDGSGLGRSDSFGLVEPASKLAKDDILNKPDGRAPQARVGGVQQRDRYSIQGDSFLMTSDETLEHRSSSRSSKPAVMEFAPIPTSASARDAAVKQEQQDVKNFSNCKEAFSDLSLVQAGVGLVIPVTAPVQGGAAFVSQVIARICEKVAQQSQAKIDELNAYSFPNGNAPTGGGYETADGGKADASTLQKVNILQKLVNPNRPLGPDSDPRNQDPLVNLGRGDAADTVHSASPDKGFFAGVNAGVICPGPDQLKALVSPGQVDFLTGAFQQKTDALINPARNDDGSVGGPSFVAPGRVSAGQAGFNAISTDGLSERNVADFVLTQGAAAHGFQSISTDGLSERPVVGFSLGQVPSAANGFQAISTDGLSERNGVGQAFMAATQGSASADPFAPATPITPVF